VKCLFSDFILAPHPCALCPAPFDLAPFNLNALSLLTLRPSPYTFYRSVLALCPVPYTLRLFAYAFSN
jgi:hypothetical protein